MDVVQKIMELNSELQELHDVHGILKKLVKAKKEEVAETEMWLKFQLEPPNPPPIGE